MKERKKESETGFRARKISEFVDAISNMPKIWSRSESRIDTYTPELVEKLYKERMFIPTLRRNKAGCICVMCKKVIVKKSRAVLFYDFRVMSIDRRNKYLCLKCYVKLTDREIPPE